MHARRSLGRSRLPAPGQACYWLLLLPRGRARLAGLRVNRSDAPLAGLRRLLDAWQACDGFSHAVDALFGGDAATALASAGHSLTWLPGEENLRFIRAGAPAASGNHNSALTKLRSLITGRPSWESSCEAAPPRA